MSGSAGSRARYAAILTTLPWVLTGCQSAPFNERSAPSTQEAAPQERDEAGQNKKIPSAPTPDVQTPDYDVSNAAPPVLPPCVPEPKPKPKPKRKVPQPSPAPAAPASGTAPSSSSNDAAHAQVRPFDGSVVSILGKKVQGLHGEDLGRVVDVLADADGRIRAAVIEFGGFLGVGDRRIPVDWSLLHFHPDDRDKPLILSVSQKELQSVPEYKDSARPPALMAPQQ